MIVRFLIALLRRFGKCSTGTIAVMFAVVSPVLLACVGVVVDFSAMSLIRGNLQAAADVAALAGAKELGLAGSTEAQIEAVARIFVKANLASTPFAPSPPSSGGGGSLKIGVKVQQRKNTVEVKLAQTWAPFFLHFLSGEVTPVRVEARAHSVASRLACVVGLSPILPTSVQLWENASLTADGCDVYSNTELPTGLIVSDNATLKAELICVSGGYVAVSPHHVEPQPTTDCPAFEDPLAERRPPKVGGCDYFATVILNQNRILDPGVYCGGLTILGNSTVELNPGIYIISNGLFQVADSATLVGENTGFFLTGLETIMYFDSGSTIDLTAPKSGPLAGILFYEDPKAPPLRVHRIGSNNARNLLGTIYLPVGILLLDSNAPVADRSDYTAIIARSLQLREGPKLVLNANYEFSDVPVPEGLIIGAPVLVQ